MPVRLRKLLGSFAVVAFLLLYAEGAVALYRYVPRNAAAEFLYFALAGVLWGIPLLPLIRWMNGPSA